MSQPVLVAPPQCNHEWTSNSAGTIDQICVIVRNTHAHEPNVQDEEQEDAPKDGHHNRLDSLPRLDGLASNDSDVLRRPEAERRLHKRLCQALHVRERAGVLPVAELDGAVRGSDAAGRHDEHVRDDNEDGQDLDPAHGVLNVAVHTHGEDVGDGGEHEEHGNVAGERDLLPAIPVLEHADGGRDLGRNDHDPLEPEVDAFSKAQRWIDVFGGHANEAAVHGTVGRHLSDGHVEDPDDEAVGGRDGSVDARYVCTGLSGETHAWNV